MVAHLTEAFISGRVSGFSSEESHRINFLLAERYAFQLLSFVYWHISLSTYDLELVLNLLWTFVQSINVQNSSTMQQCTLQSAKKSGSKG